MTKALKRLEAAKIELALAESAVDRERGRRKILCSCGLKHPINTLDLVIVQHYDSNTGSPNGGYWSDGEWNFECPEGNGVRNRIMFDDYHLLYEDRGHYQKSAERVFVRLYSTDLWKSYTRRMDKDLSWPFFNNQYVDENRKPFELPEKPKK